MCFDEPLGLDVEAILQCGEKPAVIWLGAGRQYGDFDDAHGDGLYYGCNERVEEDYWLCEGFGLYIQIHCWRQTWCTSAPDPSSCRRLQIGVRVEVRGVSLSFSSCTHFVETTSGPVSCRSCDMEMSVYKNKRGT